MKIFVFSRGQFWSLGPGGGGGGGGGGSRVHRSRVGSAGLRDLKILHVLQRLKKGGQNSTKIPQC